LKYINAFNLSLLLLFNQVSFFSSNNRFWQAVVVDFVMVGPTRT
jgi:hypothetical protein